METKAGSQAQTSGTTHMHTRTNMDAYSSIKIMLVCVYLCLNIFLGHCSLKRRYRQMCVCVHLCLKFCNVRSLLTFLVQPYRLCACPCWWVRLRFVKLSLILYLCFSFKPCKHLLLTNLLCPACETQNHTTKQCLPQMTQKGILEASWNKKHQSSDHLQNNDYFKLEPSKNNMLSYYLLGRFTHSHVMKTKWSKGHHLFILWLNWAQNCVTI